MIGPRARSEESENVSCRFAAAREKSGARDPIPSVSVRFCIPKSNVSYRPEQNKSLYKQRTTRGTNVS